MSGNNTKSRLDRKINKDIFSDYADFECDRNVFMEISRVYESVDKVHQWRNDKEIHKRYRTPGVVKGLLDRGHEYEQEVYKELRGYAERHKRRFDVEILKASISKDDTVYRTLLLEDTLKKYVQQSPNEELALLEHEYKPSFSFQKIFGDIPIATSRPDIILVKPISQLKGRLKYLDQNGKFRVKDSSKFNEQYGISVIDIKSIPEDRVSHKYFNEILYYLQTLNHFIHDNKLDEFVVLAQDSGIFPTYENLKIYDYYDLVEKMVSIDIEQTIVLYENTIDLIETFNQCVPADRTDIQHKFGAHCDKCEYLDDCLIRSGYDQEKREWEDVVQIEVLPNVNTSIISQLKSDNIKTIKDLRNRLPQFKSNTFPKPINSLIPLLDHKSDAIIKKDIANAKVDEIYSTAIPQYTRNKVTFTLETDSTTDLAFAFGILFETSLKEDSTARYKEFYQRWWLGWIKFLDKVNKKKETRLKRKELKEFIKTELESMYTAFDSYGFIDLPESDVKNFGEYLLYFNDTSIGDNKSLRYEIPGQKRDNGERIDRFKVEIAYVNISLDITKDAEEVFLKQIIKSVARIIEMTFIIERNIGVQFENNWNRISRSYANTAFFYWSTEIVEKFEELLEKHMNAILADDELYNDLYRISQWISPSNQVSDPHQIKRIYDMSKFVENVLGLPLPINYTWHRTAEILLDNFGYNSNYWSALFNNMDRSRWHEFIVDRKTDQIKSSEKYKEIQGQIYSKTRTMALLVNYFQFNEITRPLISKNPINKPQEVKTKVTDELPVIYHPLAKNWYIFARLTEAVQELETVELRSTYPQAAIGRLEAAKVDNLVQNPQGKDFVYSFTLKGLNRNVKFQESDRVLLIPISIRDSILSYGERKWQVTLQQMIWNDTDQSYYVRTEPTRNELFEMAEEPYSTEWYLYPTTGGFWARKLFSSSYKALLVRNGMGKSMLGQRLAIMWDLSPEKEMKPLQSWEFSSPQVYMYAPDLLQNITYQRPANLLTRPKYAPDPSQLEAIKFALESPLRLILGPPGTGKSQTIVAIIDEFLQRRHANGVKDSKILITSFAYTASNVLLEKICEAVDNKGNPNLAAKSQKIFIMSQSRELPQLSNDGPTYQVERLAYRSNGWDFSAATDNNERITPSSNKLEDYLTGDSIFIGNAHQIYHLDHKDSKDNYILYNQRLEFDLIIVDEASQLPTDHMLSIYQHVKNAEIEIKPKSNYSGVNLNPVELHEMEIVNPDKIKSHVVLVGDDNQLPPVQPIKPPENLQVHLGSVFDYYKSGFDLDYRQLEYNYRSHELIVKFTESLDIYNKLEASPKSVNRNKLIPGDVTNVTIPWIKDVLDPQKIVVSLVHSSQFDTSVSMFEAELCVEIIVEYHRMVNPQTEEEAIKFWYEGLGIVAPHNAHSRTIINMVFQKLTKNNLNVLKSTKLMEALKDTIFSVEKFQGSERDLIIGTIGVSAKDQLRAEEEFIYDLNRINVLTTRAKSKMILICSENFLQHIPKDQERFFDISILKKFTYQYCDNYKLLPLGNNNPISNINYYWRSI